MNCVKQSDFSELQILIVNTEKKEGKSILHWYETL